MLFLSLLQGFHTLQFYDGRIFNAQSAKPNVHIYVQVKNDNINIEKPNFFYYPYYWWLVESNGTRINYTPNKIYEKNGDNLASFI